MGLLRALITTGLAFFLASLFFTKNALRIANCLKLQSFFFFRLFIQPFIPKSPEHEPCESEKELHKYLRKS